MHRSRVKTRGKKAEKTKKERKAKKRTTSKIAGEKAIRFHTEKDNSGGEERSERWGESKH